MSRVRTARRAVLRALAITALVALVAPAGSAAADTPWGNTGASYNGGIVCTLGGDTQVPMATWTVNGATAAFAVKDIAARGPLYDPAPTFGAAGPMQPGQAGLGADAIAALAYLLSHQGEGSAADVAETSATVAALTGHGQLQHACLGQQGTSATHASDSLDTARRLAGPYTLRVAPAGRTAPGHATTVTATVTSAAGAAVPGVDVTFSVDGQDSTATTAADGTATTSVTTPQHPVPVTAEIHEPVGLTYFATDPPSIALGAATPVRATGTLAPAAPPHPQLRLGGQQLVLALGTTTPTVTLTGTNGYAGSGTVSVLGPLPGRGQCAVPSRAVLRSAANAWEGSFTFTGDGRYDGGSTTTLAAGCYATVASVETSDSTPAVRAAASPAELVVTPLRLGSSSAAPVAPPGRPQVKVLASSPGAAKVETGVVAYGPLRPSGGQCGPDLDWAHAPQAGSTSATALVRTRDGLGAQLAGPELRRTGCYALQTQSRVSLDGLSATSRSVLGAVGSTTLVAAPTIALATSGYSADLGSPMTGSISIVGAYKYPGVVRIGLRASPERPITGCRDARIFSTAVAGETTSMSTAGDGTYRFSTPPPTRNVCYAVVASLMLDANHAVHAQSPVPASDAVFLGARQPVGIQPDRTTAADAGTSTRELVVFGVVLLLLLGLVYLVTGYAREESAGLGFTWRPYAGEAPLPDGGETPPAILTDAPRPAPEPVAPHPRPH